MSGVVLFQFRYSTMYNIYFRKGDDKMNAISILCINDGKVYTSATSAACAYGTTASEVCKLLAGKRHMIGNGHMFVKIYGNETKEELESIIARYLCRKFKLSFDIQVFLPVNDGDQNG